MHGDDEKKKKRKEPNFRAKLTFCVCIFAMARFYADDIPYRIGDFGPFRGWRRRGCLRHYLTVESAAVPVFRGDFGVVGVLWRVIFPNLAQFVKSTGCSNLEELCQAKSYFFQNCMVIAFRLRNLSRLCVMPGRTVTETQRSQNLPK